MSEEYDLLLKGGTCVFPWGEAQADIGVRGGKIATIGAASDARAAEVIDARNLQILPGLIDPHVHLRDPGNAAIESIPTGTRAAVLGGIATLFDQPNTSPAITDAATVAWKQQYAATHSYTDFGFYVGATKGNIAELAGLETQDGVCAVKVFAGSSTGDLLVEDDVSIEAVLRSGHRRVAFHSEDEYRLQARKNLFKSGDPYRSHMDWRDPECAALGTRRIMALARKTGRPAHILHTSAEEEFPILADYRDVATCEVLVNHLTQVAPECYDTLGGFAVMNPPIRDRRHFDAAWRAVNEGLVDCIGSDHAPHPYAAKLKPWPECPAGLTGVQTSVPVMLDHVAKGRLSLARMVDLMAAGPARVYGAVTKGRIAQGYDADFTIVDRNAQRTITNQWIASPVGWTPFDGMKVQGWPIATIVGGRLVMREDQVIGEAGGKLVIFK
jgi:dihydroorotase